MNSVSVWSDAHVRCACVCVFVRVCVCVCVCVCLCLPVTPPAQRVQFLIGREEVCDDEDHQAHAMFCEMEELRPSGEDGEKEWKEIARLPIEQCYSF